MTLFIPKSKLTAILTGLSFSVVFFSSTFCCVLFFLLVDLAEEPVVTGVVFTDPLVDDGISLKLSKSTSWRTR